MVADKSRNPVQGLNARNGANQTAYQGNCAGDNRTRAPTTKLARPIRSSGVAIGLRLTSTARTTRRRAMIPRVTTPTVSVGSVIQPRPVATARSNAGNSALLVCQDER